MSSPAPALKHVTSCPGLFSMCLIQLISWSLPQCCCIQPCWACCASSLVFNSGHAQLLCDTGYHCPKLTLGCLAPSYLLCIPQA